MVHGRVNQPVPREDDVGLRRHRLWQLEQLAGRLGEALRRDEDAFLEVLREGREGLAFVKLGGGR